MMTAIDAQALTITHDEPLLGARDHTVLLQSVHANAPRLLAAIDAPRRGRGPSAVSILRALSQLEAASSRARHTAWQVLSFLKPLAVTPLPASYAATLASLDRAIAGAQHPIAVVHSLVELRKSRAHEQVAGFSVGVATALDLIGDALQSSRSVEDAVPVFGKRRPTGVVQACARGCVAGALGGTLTRMGPEVGAVSGGIAGTVQSAVAAILLDG